MTFIVFTGNNHDARGDVNVLDYRAAARSLTDERADRAVCFKVRIGNYKILNSSRLAACGGSEETRSISIGFFYPEARNGVALSVEGSGERSCHRTEHVFVHIFTCKVDIVAELDGLAFEVAGAHVFAFDEVCNFFPLINGGYRERAGSRIATEPIRSIVRCVEVRRFRSKRCNTGRDADLKFAAFASGCPLGIAEFCRKRRAAEDYEGCRLNVGIISADDAAGRSTDEVVAVCCGSCVAGFAQVGNSRSVAAGFCCNNITDIDASINSYNYIRCAASTVTEDTADIVVTGNVTDVQAVRDNNVLVVRVTEDTANASGIGVAFGFTCYGCRVDAAVKADSRFVVKEVVTVAADVSDETADIRVFTVYLNVRVNVNVLDYNAAAGSLSNERADRACLGFKARIRYFKVLKECMFAGSYKAEETDGVACIRILVHLYAGDGVSLTVEGSLEGFTCGVTDHPFGNVFVFKIKVVSKFDRLVVKVTTRGVNAVYKVCKQFPLVNRAYFKFIGICITLEHSRGIVIYAIFCFCRSKGLNCRRNADLENGSFASCHPSAALVKSIRKRRSDKRGNRNSGRAAVCAFAAAFKYAVSRRTCKVVASVSRESVSCSSTETGYRTSLFIIGIRR